MRKIFPTLVAWSVVTSAAAAEPVDPTVPRALTGLNRLGTPAAILERATVATAAVLDIAVRFDSIVQVDIRTHGQPTVHVWEPLHLEDRVRLRAEIGALPAATVIAPAAGGEILDFSVESDSAAGATVVIIDMPRIAWGRVDTSADGATIRLATERPADAAVPVPAVPANTATLAQRAGVLAATVLEAVRAAATVVAVQVGAAARAIAAQAARIDITALLAYTQPHHETIALATAATLAALLLVIRLRRQRSRRPAGSARPAANPWVVRTLARKGAGVRDIAVQTGLSREAVLLLMRVGGSPPRAAERAAYGRNFPASFRAGGLPMRMAS